MKRFVAMLFVSLVIAGAAAEAFAQTDEYLRNPHRYTLWMEAGVSIPSQPSVLNHLWNTSWPFSGGVGYAIFSWLEVGGGLSTGSFGISEIPAKNALGLQTTAGIEGGDISVLQYFGTLRAIAVPNQQLNPFFELRIGVFNLSASDLEVEGTSSGSGQTTGFATSMEDVDGIAVSFGGGLQYALSDVWTAYTKFLWTVNLGDDFAPAMLVIKPGDERAINGESMQYGTVTVGLLIRI